jgi:ankyrin repeat protein
VFAILSSLTLSSFEHNQVIHTLLDGGANPDVRSGKDGITALMIAASKGRNAAVFSLVEHNAHLDYVDKVSPWYLFMTVFTL